MELVSFSQLISPIRLGLFLATFVLVVYGIVRMKILERRLARGEKRYKDAWYYSDNPQHVSNFRFRMKVYKPFLLALALVILAFYGSFHYWW